MNKFSKQKAALYFAMLQLSFSIFFSSMCFSQRLAKFQLLSLNTHTHTVQSTYVCITVYITRIKHSQV